MPSSHLIFCRPLLFSPSIIPSVRVFSNESILCITCPKYWSSASTSVLPMNTQGWSPLRWTGWISLLPKGLSRVFSNTTVQKHQFFAAQPSLQSNSHIHTWPQEKTIALTRRTLVGKVMSLLFNMLSRLVITFPPRSKHLFAWLMLNNSLVFPMRLNCFASLWCITEKIALIEHPIKTDCQLLQGPFSGRVTLFGLWLSLHGCQPSPHRPNVCETSVWD